jgi:hypothetical protein
MFENAAQLTFDAAYKRCKSKSELGPHQHKFNETYVVFRYSIHICSIKEEGSNSQINYWKRKDESSAISNAQKHP